MSLDVHGNQHAATTTSQEDRRSHSPASKDAAQEVENDFAALLDAYEGRTQTFSEGEVIKGRVIAVTPNGVVVDVGFKSEGIIPIEQFADERGQVSVKMGDTVDVFLEATEDSHGYVVLSDVAECAYKCTDYYDPNSESGVIWNDADLAIAWPIDKPTLSVKDQRLPKLSELAAAP